MSDELDWRIAHALERIAAQLEAGRAARRYVVLFRVMGARDGYMLRECYEVFSAADAMACAQRRGVVIDDVRALLDRECPICCNGEARAKNHCNTCGRSDEQVERDFRRKDSR